MVIASTVLGLFYRSKIKDIETKTKPHPGLTAQMINVITTFPVTAFFGAVCLILRVEEYKLVIMAQQLKVTHTYYYLRSCID